MTSAQLFWFRHRSIIPWFAASLAAFLLLAGALLAWPGFALAQPTTASLNVTKVLIPPDDPGLFNLQINGITEAADASNLDATAFLSVNTGTATVGETAGTATSLSNYTTTIVCGEQSAGNTNIASGSDAGPLVVPVNEGDLIGCVITNTRISVEAIGGLTNFMDGESDSSGLPGGFGLLLSTAGVAVAALVASGAWYTRRQRKDNKT